MYVERDLTRIILVYKQQLYANRAERFAPASSRDRLTDPTPAMNRSVSSRNRCVRAAIGTKTVLSDDVSIMNPNTRLPPNRCASQPDGTWVNIYPQ